MALPPGGRLGVYEISAPIGEGGMGQVFRATDTTLGRQVAIKLLPDAFASDPERLARFEREAKTLASLNHPHIAAIYGFEKSGTQHALVMELVEGEDLSQRIKRGPIPIDEALPIARQIAEALEAAHEQGIVHRDLKPANIKVRDDGTVKVLDFGLAKQGSGVGDQGSGNLANSPTITSPAMTQAGIILGTAAYMSPEQAKGKLVDKRADIWAFGCVLYEMLTGRRVFAGDDVSELLVAVLSKEPNWGALPLGNAAVQFVIRRCLEKDPRRRLRDIGEARLALDGSFAPIATGPAQGSSASRSWIAALAAALIVIAMLALPAIRGLRGNAAPVAEEIRAELSTPDTNSPAGYALSPDGRHIVFAAADDRFSGLWLRALDGTSAQPLKGTEGGRAPFWSPDGRSLGFFTAASLKRIDLGSDAPRELAGAIFGQGGSWNEQGDIVFAASLLGPLLRVSANGGGVTRVTKLAIGEGGHVAPKFLPDGRTLIFTAIGTKSTIQLAALDSSAAATQLADGDANSTYVTDGPGGWLLWVGGGRLQARRLALDRRELTGDPIVLAERVGSVAASKSGLIAYRGAAQVRHQLTWMNRKGDPLGTVGEVDARTLGAGARVSPDGKRIAVTREIQGNTDIWILDGSRSTRLTFDPGIDGASIWSPDGSRLLFASNRDGKGLGMFQKLSSGAGAEEPVIPSGGLVTLATDWSKDGKSMIGFSNEKGTGADLVVWPWSNGSAGALRVFLRTSFSEVFPRFSPDGRWVAYQSDQSGRNEAFVRPFESASDTQWQVSTAGGVRPMWSKDGKELYFLDPAGNMMAATMTSRGAAMESGTPVRLFASHIVAGGIESMQVTDYDIAPDGRFLINVDLGSVVPPITLLINWQPPK